MYKICRWCWCCCSSRRYVRRSSLPSASRRLTLSSAVALKSSVRNASIGYWMIVRRQRQAGDSLTLTILVCSSHRFGTALSAACWHWLGMLVICEYEIAYAIAHFAKTSISHIFLHIVAFSKIAYAKIIPHVAYSKIRIYSHICRIWVRRNTAPIALAGNYRTGRKLPHRRLKRPLTLILTLTLRQRPIVCSCRHARSGRFKHRCSDLMPVR